MPTLRKVNPNLMFAAGLQPHFEEGRFRALFQYMNMGDGEFSCSGFFRGVYPVYGVFGEVRSNAEIPGTHSPLDDGEVPAARAVVFELTLQILLRFDRLGEDQQP